MGWNTKKLRTSAAEDASRIPQIGPGGAIALNPSYGKQQPYKDGWSIERAYQEGVQKVTWVYRCIDVIAGNQARLPVILRKDNIPWGEVVKESHSNSDVLRLLNTRANVGENSFAFRYRLSSQLLMSTRGVFIEKIYSKSGKLLALNLLPPEYTSPIPDHKNFVSGYDVDMPIGERYTVPADKVLWIRKPHPLNPYLSLTPLESAGIAIEIENLAKLYNRNFLQADGRPGLLLVARGEIEIDDRKELESRFRGGTAAAGKTTVIGSDDGIDVIDMSANPRDAAYVQMREITKDEILAAFGVPMPAIGNSSSRSFSNASEEMRGFWNETMIPHLSLIARGLDELDDKNYVDFDTREVPTIVLLRMERDRFKMEELDAGAISVNEYRDGTGREEVKSDLADSLLLNPNLTPIANTKKEFKPESIAPPAPPAPPVGPVEGAPVDGAPVDEVVEPVTADEKPVENDPKPSSDFIEASLAVTEFSSKDGSPRESEWFGKFGARLTTLLEEQKVRTLDNLASGIFAFDVEEFDKDFEASLRPMVREMIVDSYGSDEKSKDSNIDRAVDEHMVRLKKANQTTYEEIAVAHAMTRKDSNPLLAFKAAVTGIMMKLLGFRKKHIAESEVVSAMNHGVYLKAQNQGMFKTWISESDDKVRSAHVELHGKSVAVGSPFELSTGRFIRFPGDPLADIDLTAGCRCKLRLGRKI